MLVFPDQVAEYLLIDSQGELWTLGGKPRVLRREGAGNNSYFSWVICQRLDESRATNECIEILGKGVKVEDRRQLSSSESRTMFQRRLRYMTGGTAMEVHQTQQSESRSCSPMDYLPRTQTFVLPTPPASPDQQLLQAHRPAKKVLVQGPELAQQHPPLSRPWRGIFELSGKKKGRYVFRNSFIHPQVLPHSSVDIRGSSSSPIEILSEDGDSDMENSSTVYSTREPSPSQADARDEDLYSADIPSLKGPDLLGAFILKDISRKDEEEKRKLQAAGKTDDNTYDDIYDDDADIYLDADSPREAWEANKPASNQMFTALCNLKNPDCPYTILSTRLHYHCPPEKCKLTQSGFPLHNTLQEEHDPTHVHCVSRLGPFPDSAGECHLQNRAQLDSFPKHTCCFWDQAAQDTIPARGKRAYNARKLEEAKRKHMRIYDRRDWIRLRLDLGGSVSLRDCDLGVGGRGLMEMSDGELREVKRLTNMGFEPVRDELGGEVDADWEF